VPRALRPTLALLAIFAVALASVAWFRDHEGDGRSDYEKLARDGPSSRPVPLACFARGPEEGEIGDLNERLAGDTVLVPGQPEQLLLCRYWGLNHGHRSLRLAKRKLVANPATVRLIAGGLNRLPPFPRGEFACPFDEGARTYALFAYPEGSPLVVELSFEGCAAATNGRARAASLRDPVARQVMKLVP
jgi:hypothetical protein